MSLLFYAVCPLCHVPSSLGHSKSGLWLCQKDYWCCSTVSWSNSTWISKLPLCCWRKIYSSEYKVLYSLWQCCLVLFLLFLPVFVHQRHLWSSFSIPPVCSNFCLYLVLFVYSTLNIGLQWCRVCVGQSSFIPPVSGGFGKGFDFDIDYSFAG